MKCVIQRVSRAEVITNMTREEIEQGMVIFVGVHKEDIEKDILWCCNKIASLRIFGDTEGKMNYNIRDISGEIMVISQFTLHASMKKGNRPSFHESASSTEARKLYDQFVEKLQELVPNEIKTGVFGAKMQVNLTNDGPITIIMDSKE